MYSIHYYVKRDNAASFATAQKLLSIQNWGESSVRFIKTRNEILNEIKRQDGYNTHYFAIQMISNNLNLISPLTTIYYICNIHDNMNPKHYECLITSLIRLSDNKEKYSMIREIESIQDKYLKKSILENCFSQCYGEPVPSSASKLLSIALDAMERSFDNTVQKYRRSVKGVGADYFYQVFCYPKDANLIWGENEGEYGIEFEKALTYQTIKSDSHCIKFNLCEYYIHDMNMLEKLINEHRMNRVSDNYLIDHICNEAISDCYSSALVTEESPIAYASSNCNNAASGKAIFGNEEIEVLKRENAHYILVKNSITPNDLEYIALSDGIITGECSMTSHQALIAKQLGKVLIFDCKTLLDISDSLYLNNILLNHATRISVDGRNGSIYLGNAYLAENKQGHHCLRYIARLCKKVKDIGIMINCEDIENLAMCKDIYFEGVGLFRSEYMMPQNEIRRYLREAIVSDDYDSRLCVLNKLAQVWTEQLSGFFKTIGNEIVTIRTLDYPLHELFFSVEDDMQRLSEDVHLNIDELQRIINTVSEKNSLLGNRGCRFSIAFPEIFIAQIKSIFDAILSLECDNRPRLRIMFPMIADVAEIEWMSNTIRDIVCQNERYKIVPYEVGAMIETPRALYLIDRIAKCIDFCSFGTNDLTQLVWGLSREDYADILKKYTINGILNTSPYESIDKRAVLPLIKEGVKKARLSNKNISIGICGAQALKSVKDVRNSGIDHISINPTDMPYALLKCAQIAL